MGIVSNPPAPGSVRLDPASGLPATPIGYDLVAGTFLLGDRASHAAFQACVYAAMELYRARGWFVGKDQTLFNACFVAHPERFEVVRAPADEDLWFYPQKYFS